MLLSKLFPGLIVLLPSLILAHIGGHREVPPWQAPTAWPDRVITTIAGTPQTSFSVSWRTDRSVGVAIAELAPASADARFDLQAQTYRARTQSVELEEVEHPEWDVEVIENAGLEPVHYHSVTFNGLEPNTLYAYRVRGAKGKWSPWRQYRTAPEDGAFQFLFFGDSQTGIRSHITRLFDTAARVAPEARFAIHGGDLVNTAMYDKEWAEWFEALGRTHAVIPSIPVAGNHDYINFAQYNPEISDPKLFMVKDKAVSPIWRPQFELPVESLLPEGLHETVYTIRYTQDLQVFVLDSSGIEFDFQLDWLERQIAASDARWKILTMHHPLFSFVGGREHPSHKERRLPLLETLRKTEIDLILTGHRHTYQRGAYDEDDVARFGIGDPHDVKTMFVITASSTKRGESKVEGWDTYSEDQEGRWKLDRHADNTPLFALFDVSEGSLQCTIYDAVGGIYDAWRLDKDEAGKKQVTNLDAAFLPIREMSNTGPYKGWDDLR